jgi:hypothetical protein
MAFDNFRETPTAYYHLRSPCDLARCDFRIKVTLRRVTRDEKHPQTIEKCIQWQEKIIGPKESSHRFNGRGTSSDPWSRVGEIYSTLNDSNRGKAPEGFILCNKEWKITTLHKNRVLIIEFFPFYS